MRLFICVSVIFTLWHCYYIKSFLQFSSTNRNSILCGVHAIASNDIFKSNRFIVWMVVVVNVHINAHIFCSYKSIFHMLGNIVLVQFSVFRSFFLSLFLLRFPFFMILEFCYSRYYPCLAKHSIKYLYVLFNFSLSIVVAALNSSLQQFVFSQHSYVFGALFVECF